jgi:oligosaccharide reducing-end xylanase
VRALARLALTVAVLVLPAASPAAAQPAKKAQVTEASTAPPGVAFTRHQEAPLWKVTRHPGEGKGAYATGTYRNLFSELLGCRAKR